MTTALTSLSAIPKLAAAAVHYIRTVPAPEPATVTLNPIHCMIEIQPAFSGDSVQAIGSLLIWTHHLTGLAGDWWRTSDDSLHVTLIGRGSYGVAFKVYSGIPYAAAKPHVRLARGDSESATPDELYRLALELRTGGAA